MRTTASLCLNKTIAENVKYLIQTKIRYSILHTSINNQEYNVKNWEEKVLKAKRYINPKYIDD